MHSPVDLSVIVPLFNEEDSVQPLTDAVRDALGTEMIWELVLVDDGSSDATANVASAAADSDARVRLVRLARNYGQTQAMQAGFDYARGEVIVSMDGDLQNDPRDIPVLVAKLAEGYDLVAGYRRRRQDALLRRKLPSFIANRLIAWLTGIRIRDNGCSLKAFRRSITGQLHLYSDMHRFLPAVAFSIAGARIAEVPVRHHARRFGTSKYGISRVAKLLADLFTIKMITSFRERPLLMFGGGALAAMTLAAVFAATSVISLMSFQEEKARAYVLPTAALLWLVLAGYLLLLGLIAAVALHKSDESESPVSSTPSAGVSS
jgi:glycosyltransferase involved in cell wall biosynthesis